MYSGMVLIVRETSEKELSRLSLEEQFLSLPDADPHCGDLLKKLGMSPSIVGACEGIKTVRATFERTKFYSDDTAEACLVFAEWRSGCVHDLVAVNAARRFATREGRTCLLGGDSIRARGEGLAPATGAPLRVRIYASLNNWLAAHRDGVFVFDWRYAWVDLIGADILVAENIAHARSIDRRLPPKLPQIHVPITRRFERRAA